MALPNGPVSTFHPDGQLASRAEYVDGKLEGVLFRFAPNGAGEPLRPCCVPPGASELRAEYRHGELLHETFFDAEGRALCGDGTPWPARPEGVPDVARFDDTSGRFYESFRRDDGVSVSRYFAPEGFLAEELDVSRGRVVARRRFAPDGTCVEEWELDDHGLRHGPTLRRFVNGESPYGDARIREERARFEHGERAGELRLCDASGATLALVELGAPLADGASPLVLGSELEHESVEVLFEHAERLRVSQRTREALAVAARAAGQSGDLARFSNLLERVRAKVHPAVADELARLAAEEKPASASRLLAALVNGADPAAVLRLLASTVPTESPAALAYADTALLLAPDDPLALMVRGLARLERGDRDGALADAARLAAVSASAAEFLREYCRCVFSEFLFEPLEHPVEEGADQLLDVGCAQPLEAVERTVRLYATRLTALRGTLVAMVGEVAWLPPDVSALLRGEPVPLERHTIRIQDETEEGVAEETEVVVDETLPEAERSVRRLMTLARANWAGLSWLCWSVGLDHVGMPNAIESPALFAEGANRATLRCFWAHDRLRTEGLVAAARGVPTFTWEGLPIESMPRHLVELAAAEYLEIRAQFLWALFPENVSPFQADLRKV